MSLSTGDYTAIAPLLARLMDRCAAERVAVSLPSLRAGTLTPELMDLIRQVRKTGFTIAPEAGSQRLRDVINKNITEEEIAATVENAFRLGWQVIKLYFMIGLPTETEADLEEMVGLVDRLRRIKGPKGRRGQINVSVGTFIPKPHTPFQWSPQLSIPEARVRIDRLRERIRGPGVRLKWQDPRISQLEGLWSRGDGRLARLLVTAHELGCRLDGWSDHLDFDKWEAAMEREGIDIDHYTTRPRDLDEPLPWDFVAIVDKAFLKAEWERARMGAPTADCRTGECNACGVCDFETVLPRVGSPAADPGFAAEAGGGKPRPEDGPDRFRKLQVTFTKEGEARFFGHLEMVNIFVRALRRAAVPVAYSKGFHPMPKIAFSDPLPIGLESRCERFDLSVRSTVTPETVVAGLNAHLPAGLRVLGAGPVSGEKGGAGGERIDRYRVTPPPGSPFDPGAIASFRERESWVVTRTNRKGKLKKIDLKDMIRDIDLDEAGRLWLSLGNAPGKTVRPAEVLREIFSLPEEGVQQSRMVKMEHHVQAAGH
jgi:radical SAM-linked protein